MYIPVKWGWNQNYILNLVVNSLCVNLKIMRD